MLEVLEVLEVEESTPHHWVGTCEDIVLAFAYEGSYDDVGHIHAMERAVDKLRRRQRFDLKLLFVLPSRHSKPPTEAVRNALLKSIRAHEGIMARGTVVVAGSGFVAALHRGAVTGIVTLLRLKVPYKVTSSLREGLDFLLGPSAPLTSRILLQCERLANPP